MTNRNETRGPTRRTLLRASALTGIGSVLAGSGLLGTTGSALAAQNGASFTPNLQFFNAHHAPIGAYATFTLGYPGASGGFGTEQNLPGKQSVFVGVRSDGRTRGLPFFDTAAEPGLVAYTESEVTRDFRAASDSFTTPDFSFTLYNPVRSVPDPTGSAQDSVLRGGPLTGLSTSGKHAINDVLLPAIFAEMVIDNTLGSTEMMAAFAVAGGNAQVMADALGVMFGTAPRFNAIVTDDTTAVPFTAATMTQAITGSTGAGPVGGLAITVPAGKKRTIRFALCFHRAGAATTGRATSFWYTQYYADIQAVAVRP